MPTLFNRASTVLSTTSITDVYQAPNTASTDRAIVLSVLAANVNASSSADITVTITDSANAAISRIVNTITVPAKSTLEAIPNKVVLKQGEKLRATASSANMFEVTASTLEVT